MSYDQQVIWTALPRPYNGKSAEVSVMVSPRLGVDSQTVSLKEFPVWLDWPAVVAKAEFHVIFGDQVFKGLPTSRPDSKVWGAVFDDRTIVRPRENEDLTEKLAMSYNAAALQRRLRDTYVQIANDWSSVLPRAIDLQPMLTAYAEAPNPQDALDDLSGPNAAGARKEWGDRYDLAEFHAFMQPLLLYKDTPFQPLDPQAAIEGMDFHRLVAAIGQHSLLLRQTGLVIDLELAGLPEPGELPLSVKVAWREGKGVETRPDGRPQLMTRFDKKVFEAIPSGKRIRGRRLDLEDGRFQPMQVDVDGGIIKLTGTAASVNSRENRVTSGVGRTVLDDEPMGLPTLRSTGIVLTETGRADELTARLLQTSNFDEKLKAGKEIVLHAEDVTRGYHVDVQSAGEWRSLCQITATYALRKAGLKLADKAAEGLVQLATSEAPPGAPAKYAHIMRVTESLFHWDGWSLAAPRPGLALDQDGDPKRNAEAGGLPASVSAEPTPRSLPILRFGREYRLRVRLADLAHNAEGSEEKSDKAISASHTYRRFEPVAPPVPALVETAEGVDTPEDGASLLRMVIRSGDAEMAQPTQDQDLRMLLPPRTSVDMAERHGVLDGPDGRPAVSMYQTLESRDANLSEVQSTIEQARSYPVASSSRKHTPWLPDPLAQDVRAVVTPDLPRQTTDNRWFNRSSHVIDPLDTWPNARVWTVRLREDPSDPLSFVPTHHTPYSIWDRCHWNAANRELRISLPKGETATLSLSAMFDEQSEPADIFGLAAWMKEDLPVDLYQSLRELINRGEHWAFTPDLKIELIHATQRPLVTPVAGIVAAMRGTGDMAAPLAVSTPCHAESTESLSLEGRWVEAVDGGQDAPGATWRAGTAFRERLDPDSTPNGTRAFDGTHTFGDTLYRRVRYRVVGASRFREFFPPAIRNNAAATQIASPDVVIHVPNAAPPPPPVVSGTTPVFDWLRDTAGYYKASWRRAGLRVYLDRPWFASGFGEMLAAVLPRQDDPKGFERAARHVTIWSGDPIWTPEISGNVTNLSPGIDAFPARARPTDGPDIRWPEAFPMEERALAGGSPRYEHLSLPSETGTTIAQVDAAGHPVSWDPVSNRYYSDLMFDPGRVYQPFVRLGVARLHPVSVPGCHLSASVPLEMTQILPERLVTARRHGSDGWLVEVFGVSHEAPPDSAHQTDRPWRNLIRVEVQHTAGANPDELDWITVEDPAIADPPTPADAIEQRTVVMPTNYTGTTLFPQKSGSLFDAASAFIAKRPDMIYRNYIKAPGAGGGPRGSDKWRLRVTETERHSTDLIRSSKRELYPSENERIIFSEVFEI